MLKLTNILAWSLLALPVPVIAVVIRHDVPDLKYRIEQTHMRAIANLAHEGHGVLIAPQWIVTAAHATQWHPVTEIMLDGRCRKVERLVVHAGYKEPSKSLMKAEADVAPLIAILAASDDIALIKLVDPVTDVEPLALYRGADEAGKLVQLMGMGATGNGKDGQERHGSHRTVMRRAFNVVSKADARWLGYVFDAEPGAHPLEGMSGNGDSGGPLLIEEDGLWKLAGLTSWAFAEGKNGAWKPGKYGVTAFAVRVSRYRDWISQTIAADGGTATNMGRQDTSTGGVRR